MGDTAFAGVSELAFMDVALTETGILRVGVVSAANAVVVGIPTAVTTARMMHIRLFFI